MMKSRKSFLAAAVAGCMALGFAGAASYAQQEGKPSANEKAKAARVGDRAPDFALTDLEGKTHRLSDYRGKIVMLEWFNPGCPFVVKHHQTHKTFAEMHRDYSSRDVVMLAVNSGAPGEQGTGKDLNARYAKEWGIAYPILLDESGKTGRAYGARTTPHIFIIDREGNLVFAGGIDNDNSRDRLGDTNYARKAIDDLLAGRPVATAESRPYGCSVKYRD